MRWHRSERRHSGRRLEGRRAAAPPARRRCPRWSGKFSGRSGKAVTRRWRSTRGGSTVSTPAGRALPFRRGRSTRRDDASRRRCGGPSSWRPSGSRRFTGVRPRAGSGSPTPGRPSVSGSCRSPARRVCARGEGGVSVDPADERPPARVAGVPEVSRRAPPPAARSRMSCWRPPGSPAFPRCTASAARRRSPRSPTGRSPSRAST